MGDEFHAVIKLITGEEIFALVSVDENDGDPIIMLSNPVIMKMLYSTCRSVCENKTLVRITTEDIFFN